MAEHHLRASHLARLVERSIDDASLCESRDGFPPWDAYDIAEGYPRQPTGGLPELPILLIVEIDAADALIRLRFPNAEPQHLARDQIISHRRAQEWTEPIRANCNIALDRLAPEIDLRPERLPKTWNAGLDAVDDATGLAKIRVFRPRFLRHDRWH